MDTTLTAVEQQDLTKGYLKYTYFGGLIYPRLKARSFDKRGFELKMPAVGRLRNFFLSRGGHHQIITLTKNGVPFANIGMRLINPEGRKVQVKAIFITPIDSVKKSIESINKAREKAGHKPIKTIIELVANPKKKIFIRPQSVPRIVQSLINEADKWADILTEHLN